MKYCSCCKIEKDESEFHKNQCKCKVCRKKFYLENKNKIKNYKHKYYEEHKDYVCEKSKQYRKQNINRLKLYHSNFYITHKDKIKNRCKNYYSKYKDIIKQKRSSRKIYARSYSNYKYLTNPIYKLRKLTSIAIRIAIKKQGLTKQDSIIKYIPYSIIELKQHLEKQFEPWMNWSNWGKYNSKTWNDNDQSTWKWQIDHIIPHSTFKYSSMKDESFKQCWALSNLRPYSAKLNSIEGANKSRHT